MTKDATTAMDTQQTQDRDAHESSARGAGDRDRGLDAHGLTERMRRILELTYQGKDTAQIAAALEMTPLRVKKTFGVIYERLGYDSRVALMVWWHRARRERWVRDRATDDPEEGDAA